MKNLFVLAVAALLATNAYAAEMKWSGSAGWRWANIKQDDSLSSVDNTTNNKDVSTQRNKTHQLRANLGVSGGWEHVEYGFGVRTTGSSGGANSDWVNVQNNGDRAIGLEQAWFRYLHDFGTVDLSVTIGRQKIALATDTTWGTLFDPAVRWDGFGWNFKFGQFGLNAVQYVLGTASNANTTGDAASNYTFTESAQTSAAKKKFAMLYSFQPYANWKFADEIEAMFAVAYLKYISEGHVNVAGGTNPGAWNTGTVAAQTAARYKMNNNSQWDFLTTWSLPYTVGVTGEYLMANNVPYSNISLTNYSGGWTSAPTVTKAAWNLGLTYGKLRKAQDFMLGYAYGSKGIASVISDFTSELFPADNRGHTIVAKYNLADNFNLGFAALFLKEKERIDPSTGLAYAGTKSGQKLSTRWYVLSAGVSF